jgi:hypothetical protein
VFENEGEAPHFALRSVVEIVRKIGKKGLEEIRGKLGEILRKCWNKRAEGERIFATACLDICVVLEPEWAEEITGRWKEIANASEPVDLDETKSIDFGRKFT